MTMKSYAVFNHKTCKWLRDATDDKKIALFTSRETAEVEAILAGVGVSVAEIPLVANNA
jgi:hypothetical protein